ncbi:MAG TPA: LytTR family DNA-binding domain-containing protein [Asticcacaulis sp.]
MTNDDAKWKRYAPLLVVISLLVVAITGNVAQTLVNTRHSAYPVGFFTALLQEIASAIVWLSVLPVIVWAFRNLSPFRPFGRVRLLLQAGLIPVVSLTHFVMTRILLVVIYAAAGKAYEFHFNWSYFANDLSKDVLNYILFGLIYLGAERLLGIGATEPPPPPAARAAPVIEVRDGAQVTYVAADDLLWAEAAGNYVELHLASGRKLLMRATLARLAARLEAADFLRVHRSRIANMAAVSAVENLPGGDAVLKLNGGARIAVSRSYRARVGEALARRVR